MTTPPQDGWFELQRDWQGLSAPVDASEMRARIARERRRMHWTRLGAGALALAAVAGAGLALLHTPTFYDVALATPVMALIAIAWWLERQRWSTFADALPGATNWFIAVSRQRALLQRRAVRLAWFIIAAELAFLLPWWFEGYRYHANELLAPITIMTVWLPAVFVLAVLIWTVRLHRVVQVELKRLEQIAGSAEPD